jgi:uncharacterized membrane protein SpoIIM required for sporulation
MVLESLVDPQVDEKHPSVMVLYGFIYATVGLFLGLWVFGDHASLSAVFLTTMPLVIVLFNAFKLEECKDCVIHKEVFLLKEHTHVLWFFLYLFVGLTLAYSIWFSVLPAETSEKVFSTQMDTIRAITGREIRISGAATDSSGLLGRILENNLRVLILCILFSFIYGSGAIFILTWNASVVGVAIGGIVRHAVGLSGISIGLSYLVHGLPEVAAYFLGALAGGIISIAVTNHEYRSKEFRHIVVDSIDLVVASVLVLVAAGLIEVYVTPNLF